MYLAQVNFNSLLSFIIVRRESAQCTVLFTDQQATLGNPVLNVHSKPGLPREEQWKMKELNIYCGFMQIVQDFSYCCTVEISKKKKIRTQCTVGDHYCRQNQVIAH